MTSAGWHGGLEMDAVKVCVMKCWCFVGWARAPWRAGTTSTGGALDQGMARWAMPTLLKSGGGGWRG